MGVHSLEKLGAKMGANSFYYQRVRAERNSENLGALNSLEIAKIFGFWQSDSQNISFFLVTLPWLCASILLSKLSITNMTLKLFLSFMETCNMFVQITFLSKFSITNVTFDFFLSFMTPTMCFFTVPFSPKLILQISHFFLHG